VDNAALPPLIAPSPQENHHHRRILLVEDDELFRLGLRVRLQQDPELDVSGEAMDGETAIALANTQPFDVVLLDMGLPGIGGLEACRQIKRDRPNLPILVLTSHAQPALITRLVEAGAQGYCQKGIAAELLILAVKSVAAGASWWDSTATQAIRLAVDLRPMQNPTQAEPQANRLLSNPSLTQRELEILTLMAMGKSNQTIADELYIAPGTVRVHVHAVLHKLNARDRAQAVWFAKQNGWIG
jgi:two-component system, NarL family, response regulator